MLTHGDACSVQSVAHHISQSSNNRLVVMIIGFIVIVRRRCLSYCAETATFCILIVIGVISIFQLLLLKHHALDYWQQRPPNNRSTLTHTVACTAKKLRQHHVHALQHLLLPKTTSMPLPEAASVLPARGTLLQAGLYRWQVVIIHCRGQLGMEWSCGTSSNNNDDHCTIVVDAAAQRHLPCHHQIDILSIFSVVSDVLE